MSLPTELLDYIGRPDSCFGYTVLAEEDLGGATLYDLELTSQQWQGLIWKHRLQIFTPREAGSSDLALLTIGADFTASGYYSGLGELYAQASGRTCAFLYDVPNQPLFDGKIEDELIAYTLVRYLDTGDPDWPLLLPMTKSAVRAMDAVQALMAAKHLSPPARFVTSGMSKRGWTTWLSAVADPRVAGIIPMVYDNLNLFAQMPHQREVWPDYSEEIGDYTEVDLPARMATPAGFRLAQIIDPYTYREKLTLPKLIMNGANDRYWATDALNLYWDDLAGPKHVLTIPNSGHGLNDPERIWRAALAFVHSVGAGGALPELRWEFAEQEFQLTVRVQSEAPISGGHLWVARAPSLDFRSSEWEPRPLEAGAAGAVGAVPIPPEGCLAAFAEVEVDPPAAGSCLLSTQTRIVDRRSD